MFSIIIPTVVDSPPTLQSLPRKIDLLSIGGELIVVRDRWRNASRARNVGLRSPQVLSCVLSMTMLNLILVSS